MLKRLKWIVLGILLVFLVIIIAASRFLTDLMWFDSLGFTNLFTTRLLWEWGVRLTTWLALSLVLWINLLFVKKAMEKTAIRFPQIKAYFTGKRLTWILIIASLVLGFVYSAGYSGYYFEIAQFFNSASFGKVDPVFAQDIGFYFFKLPVYQLLISGLASAILLVLVVCGALYFVSGSVIFEHGRITISQHAQKHLSFLGGLFVAVKAASYYFQKYNLLYNQSGVIFGAGYTDINIRLIVLQVLMVVALIVSLLLITRMYRYRKLFIGAIALWFIVSFGGGVLLPLVIDQWVVAPNEFTSERPYIENHIQMTRAAYGIDEFRTLNFSVDNNLSWEDLEENSTTINNIRLWDPRLILQTYSQLQEMRPYYVFNDADVGRYWVDGEYREVLLSVRELDVNLTQNSNWLNDHLQYTHGYGVVVSPVNEVSSQQLPHFWVSDIPPRGKADLQINQPRIYYGERTNEYAIVNTAIEEFDYPTGDGNAYYTYTGTGGVKLSTPLHRLAFALRFNTTRILLSSDITQDSRILFDRNIRSRVMKLAPFLQYDQDPYIVIGDDGNLYWIIDAYTVSNRYPYAQPISWGNYIRNSVKVVIDAYNGDVSFYQVEDDPVLEVYSNIFPGLLKQFHELPAGLENHLRYPEDLLSFQAQIYGTYHMTDPRIFYNREDVWVFANEIYASREQPVVPYYVVMQLPESSSVEFILMLPFTPIRRNNMIAWLAARNDGEHYGEVLVYNFPKDSLTLGPAQIDATIDQDSDISQMLSLWGQRGSNVVRGNMLVLPIAGSLIYVEPLFLQSEQSGMPQLQRVIVAYQDKLVMEDTLELALKKIFGEGVAPESIEIEPDLAVEIDREIQFTENAYELYQRAEEALREADFVAFGEAWNQLELILRQIIDE